MTKAINYDIINVGNSNIAYVILSCLKREKKLKELATMRDIEKELGRHTFVTKKKLGVCPHCEENVYDNQLFVEKKETVFHYSCYNNKKVNGDSE